MKHAFLELTKSLKAISKQFLAELVLLFKAFRA
jgi:hypothetical protein